MRLLTVLAAAAAAMSVSVPIAWAIPPTHEPVSFADRTFSGQCSFEVRREVLVNRSVLTTFSNGNRLTTGTFKERLTNLSTGEFIDVNASGPILAVSTRTARQPSTSGVGGSSARSISC